MRFIKKISNALFVIENSVIVALLAVMVLLAFVQVVLRNLFSTGFLWADPFLRHLVLWIGFMGASLATQQERHINIDVITRFLSPKTTTIITIATNVFAATICFFLAHAGWTFLVSEMTTEGSLFAIGQLEFPMWWFQTIIPIGFGLMSFRFFIKAVEHVIETAQSGNPPSPPRSAPTLGA